jgi:DNA-binding CsgD family transcriptional regulator
MREPRIPLGMIEQIYECASEADTGHWQEVYEQLANEMSAGTGSMQYIIKAENRVVPIATTNPPGFEEELSQHYMATIPYRNALFRLRPGEIFERHRHLDDGEFKRTAVYRGFLKKVDKFHVLHHCLAATPDFVAGISFTRPESRERFSEMEIANYLKIGKHIQRALKIQIELQRAAGENRLLSEGWDRMDHAAFFVDAAGRVVYYNAAAGEMINKGGVKILKTGEIGIAGHSETRRLRELISKAMITSEGSVMAIASSGQRRLYLSVSPFAEKFGPPGLARPMALITLSAPLGTDLGEARGLAKLFGLTAAESKVALMIADGDSIKEIADKLSISEQTARTHLKRIFGKTETKRQASLMKLVLSLPGAHHHR